jgi:hypothetical protein
MIAMVLTPFSGRPPLGRLAGGMSPAIVSVRCCAGAARGYLVAGAETL